MKNLKLLSLIGIMSITCILSWCFFNKDKWSENNPTEENTATGDSDFIIEDTTSSNNVIKYNNAIADYFESCHSLETTFWSTYNSYDGENTTISDIQLSLDNFINECKFSIEQLNTLWDREGDSSLKDSVITAIESYINYYRKLWESIQFLEKEGNLSDEDAKSQARIARDLENLDAKLEQANNDLILTQEVFSREYWFNDKLIED